MRSRLFITFESDFGRFWRYFWRVLWMHFGRRRNVHVDNATTRKILHFSTRPAWHTSFCLTDEFWKIANTFHEKVKKVVQKTSSNEKPCPTPLWRAFWVDFGSILVPFWLPKSSPKRFRRGRKSGRKSGSDQNAKKVTKRTHGDH